MRKFDAAVVLPDGQTARWEIQFISTRCGEPSADKDLEAGEVDAFFGLTEGRFAQLEGMMAHDVGVNFIAIVNGVPGLIFEAECLTQEIDGDNEDYAGIDLLDRATLNAKNQQILRALTEQYPEALFAVTPEEHMWDNRAGAWAFVAHDKLVAERVNALANAMCDMGTSD